MSLKSFPTDATQLPLCPMGVGVASSRGCRFESSKGAHGGVLSPGEPKVVSRGGLGRPSETQGGDACDIGSLAMRNDWYCFAPPEAKHQRLKDFNPKPMQRPRIMSYKLNPSFGAI